ncbi:MAG: hypothetical protein JRI72_00195 [Deltaproteobacteria bacterium]|nr:hypothetical protein [Deltaproteobacteria bacterium]
MRPRILLLDEPHLKARNIMESAAYCDTSWRGYNECCGYDYVYTQFTPIKIDVPVFCPCTGVDHIKAPKVIYLDAEWKRTEGQKVTSTAEHTMWLMQSLIKKIPAQLYKKRLGIIGYGRIGIMVAERAKAYGMDIYTYDTKNDPVKDKLYYLLKTSDIISIHIPLDDNKNFIGKKELEIIKPNTLIINTSRQQVLDIKALIPYLKDKILYYADDFKNEIDITQYGAAQTNHISGNCKEAREATDIYIANKIVEYIRARGG